MATVPKRSVTSGDLTANRRADYAAMLSEGGDHAAASELMEQALELAPAWVAGWFRLGEAREKAQLPGAVLAYRKALHLAPEDMFGAGLRLALLGDLPAPALPPSVYVEGLFDDYAERFDASLVERLGYSVPAKLMDLIRAHLPPLYGHVVDIGCGTGLFGAEIRAECQWLEGYDISENMLARAGAKHLYDSLARADLSLPSEISGLFGQDRPPGRADLVSATDVMIYLGDLDAAFANAASLLKPSGSFCFSVEKTSSPSGYELRPSLRYAHSADHVERALAAHNMQLLAREQTVIRMDAGEPITGLLCVAKLQDSLRG